MNILPYENYSIHTTLKTAQILSKLDENIDTKNTSIFTFIGKSTKPYRGKIFDNSFEMFRVINYRNSFLPQITGTIEDSFTNRTIHIKMKPYTLVIIFMIFWLSSIAIATIAMFTGAMPSIDSESASIAAFTKFIPLLMLVFGSVLPVLAFKYESNKSKKFLSSLFEETV